MVFVIEKFAMLITKSVKHHRTEKMERSNQEKIRMLKVIEA